MAWKSVYDDPPRKHVLLLSCMDTRLLDDTVHFMNELNLQNRYDHLILAGAGMGARLLTSASDQGECRLPWKNVFFDHLATAIDKLERKIKDIFILEHLDCGAYKALHPDEPTRLAYQKSGMSQMKALHYEEARGFAKDIRRFCQDQKKLHKGADGSAWTDIRVRCFLMDLLGVVKEFKTDLR